MCLHSSACVCLCFTLHFADDFIQSDAQESVCVYSGVFVCVCVMFMCTCLWIFMHVCVCECVCVSGDCFKTAWEAWLPLDLVFCVYLPADSLECNIKEGMVAN